MLVSLVELVAEPPEVGADRLLLVEGELEARERLEARVRDPSDLNVHEHLRVAVTRVAQLTQTDVDIVDDISVLLLLSQFVGRGTPKPIISPGSAREQGGGSPSRCGPSALLLRGVAKVSACRAALTPTTDDLKAHILGLME